ncbi:hypothetical protein BCR43DRAFT_507579 [Syncephalastrum racemosum]|uniref:Protein kinase domain-containing protein n=1 Tax=Syncephalastrum racemosum TaxID=13706 RepID=A0A1X2H419_SYNRA|nr:hypothetical protein BCR43DRAFT_507579 [Syncephalastrum racemosum]
MAMVAAPAVDARGDREPPVPTPSVAAPAHLQTPNTTVFNDDVPYITNNNSNSNSNNTPSRSYSVNAVPTNHHYNYDHHHQQQQRSVQRNMHLLHDEDQQDPPMPWWQCYYQLYHYFPPAGRKPTVFGPYLLLHTLGEGEFGKVKLGVHVESSQEASKTKGNKDDGDQKSVEEKKLSVG